MLIDWFSEHLSSFILPKHFSMKYTFQCTINCSKLYGTSYCTEYKTVYILPDTITTTEVIEVGRKEESEAITETVTTLVITLVTIPG